MPPPPERTDARSPGGPGRGLSRLVSQPGYFLACAAALGTIGVLAGASGSTGLALFAVAHMLLALIAAGWRGYELGLMPAQRPLAPPPRAEPPPSSAAAPLPGGVESARA